MSNPTSFFLAKFYCRHLQEYGTCRFNERCLFSHSRSAYKIPENVCIYFFKNPISCRNTECNFLHIDPSELITQLRVLESYDNQNNRRSQFDNEGATTSRSGPRSAFNNNRRNRRTNDLVKPKKPAHEERICGICLDDVIGDKRFGLMSNCNHIFCFDCIMTWRKTKNSAEDTKACPECRAQSDYVIPSRHYAVDEEKRRIISVYKENRKDILCKYEKNGVNSCRMKESCFFKHTLPFRNYVDRRPRYAQTNLILNAFFGDSDDEEVTFAILGDFYEVEF